MPKVLTSCDCQAIRKALGMSQTEMGLMLCVTQAQVSLYENGTSVIRGAPLVLLRTWLRAPERQEMLRDAGITYPFPEDL